VPVKPGEVFETTKHLLPGMVLQATVGDVRLEWRAMVLSDARIRFTSGTDVQGGRQARELELILRPGGDPAQGQGVVLRWDRLVEQPFPPLLPGETRKVVIRDERGLAQYVREFTR
jgi:hypothetical protein